MGSPVVESDIEILSEQARICDRLKALLGLPAQFKDFLGWLLDSSGEISDAVVTSIQDRLTPIGTVVLWVSPTLPSNRWLVCNGQTISRTTYASLFARLGTLWGVGDGSTTFNLPDFRERTAVGVGGTYSLGTVVGSATATITVPDHIHYTGALAENNDDVYLYTDATNAAAPAENSIKVSGNDSSGNPASSFMSTQSIQSLHTGLPVIPDGSDTVSVSVVQPSVVVYYIIKAL